MGVATSSTHIFFFSAGAIFHWMLLSKAEGANSFLIYYYPLVFSGKSYKIGAICCKVFAFCLGVRVDRTDRGQHIFLWHGVWGHGYICGHAALSCGLRNSNFFWCIWIWRSNEGISKGSLGHYLSRVFVGVELLLLLGCHTVSTA